MKVISSLFLFHELLAAFALFLCFQVEQINRYVGLKAEMCSFSIKPESHLLSWWRSSAVVYTPLGRSPAFHVGGCC